MNIKLCSSRWGELSLGYLSSIKGPNHPAQILIFPQADKLFSVSDKGGYSFVFQELQGERFKIRYSLCFSRDKDTYTITSDPSISLHFGFSFSHRLYHPHMGDVTFHQNSYNILYFSNSATEISMGPYDRFIIFDVILCPSLLEELENDLTIFKEFNRQVGRMLPTRLRLTNGVAPIEVLRWIDDITQFGTDGCTDKLILDDYAYELLSQSILNFQCKSEVRPLKLTQSDVDKIYTVSETLKQTEESIPMPKLAALVGLSKNKLERGFKQIFGHSVLHHRKEEKMKLALRLIDDESLSQKEVASILGYKEPQSFTRAFKIRFGYTPYRDMTKTAQKS